MSQFTPLNNTAYLKGYTSGYGVQQTINYFNNIAKSKKIIVGIAENTGNPESAILVYFYRNKNVRVAYFDSKLFPSNFTTQYDCLSSDTSFYFVSRDNQLAGLDKYLKKIRIIKNPYGNNSVGIYTLKKDCRGKTFKLLLQQTST